MVNSTWYRAQETASTSSGVGGIAGASSQPLSRRTDQERGLKQDPTAARRQERWRRSPQYAVFHILLFNLINILTIQNIRTLKILISSTLT